MEYTLADYILFYLNSCAVSDPLRPVPLSEINDYLVRNYGANNFRETDLTSALHYVIEKRYIQEDTFHYRITAQGQDYIYRATHPKPPIGEKSLKAANLGNFLAVISIMVVVFGTIYTISTTRKNSVTTSSLFTQVDPIALTTVVDSNNNQVKLTTLANWFNNPPVNNDLSVVPFYLSNESSVIEIESQDSSNPSVIVIPIKIQNVVKIHLLLNLSYSPSYYTGGVGISGQKICVIHVISNHGQVDYSLVAGQDIREWVTGAKDSVNTIGPDIKTIWTDSMRGSHVTAVIDHQTLEIPQNLRSALINFISIEDTSQSLLNNINPGIVIFGISVEHYK
jgi:hypothetical protein